MISLLVALYIRVSTAEQNADLQERELRAYAAARGWTVAIVYSEVASGTDTARPRLTELIRDARAKKFAAVLVWKLDRFGRDPESAIYYIKELASLGVGLFSITQEINSDPRTADGLLMLRVSTAFGEFEKSLIRERAAAGRKRYLQDLAAGRVGTAVHSRSGKDLPMGRPKTIFRRDEAQRLRGEGLSIRQIATTLKMSRTTIERVLKGA